VRTRHFGSKRALNEAQLSKRSMTTMVTGSRAGVASVAGARELTRKGPVTIVVIERLATPICHSVPRMAIQGHEIDDCSN